MPMPIREVNTTCHLVEVRQMISGGSNECLYEGRKPEGLLRNRKENKETAQVDAGMRHLRDHICHHRACLDHCAGWPYFTL